MDFFFFVGSYFMYVQFKFYFIYCHLKEMPYSFFCSNRSKKVYFLLSLTFISNSLEKTDESCNMICMKMSYEYLIYRCSFYVCNIHLPLSPLTAIKKYALIL